MSPTITLRPVTPHDESFLRDLFHQVHAPEFASLNLLPQALAPLLDMQFRGQALTYATQYPAAQSEIVLAEGIPAGRFLTDLQPEALHLIDIAVLPQAQGQGIGTALLAQLITQAEQLGIPIRLQVRPANPALRLYQRHGFVQIFADEANLHLERGLSKLIAHSS